MDKLDRQLLDLFQSSDGLLLPDETAIHEISLRQNALKVWRAEIVVRGLMTVKEFLQALAKQNNGGLVDAVAEIDLDLVELPSTQPSKDYMGSPSVFELTRHLSNWITVLIPPIRALDLSGDQELVKCLESKDHFIAALAAITLGHEEFNYLGSSEMFRELLNTKESTSLRLQLCQLLFTRYADSLDLEREVVPSLIFTDDQFQFILMNGTLRKRLISYLRELAAWDIATEGKGPHKKWAWWI